MHLTCTNGAPLSISESFPIRRYLCARTGSVRLGYLGSTHCIYIYLLYHDSVGNCCFWLYRRLEVFQWEITLRSVEVFYKKITLSVRSETRAKKKKLLHFSNNCVKFSVIFVWSEFYTCVSLCEREISSKTGEARLSLGDTTCLRYVDR